tara:strand:+ start:105 stop:392 length:288 start_codon:yes stop_codon:yes gene_type:complete
MNKQNFHLALLYIYEHLVFLPPVSSLLSTVLFVLGSPPLLIVVPSEALIQEFVELLLFFSALVPFVLGLLVEDDTSRADRFDDVLFKVLEEGSVI